MATGALVAAAGSVAAALLPGSALVIAANALVGLGTAAGAPLLISVAGRSASPSETGAAVGTVTTVGYLGFVVAPAAIGRLAAASTLPTVGAVAVVLALGAAPVRPRSDVSSDHVPEHHPASRPGTAGDG